VVTAFGNNSMGKNLDPLHRLILFSSVGQASRKIGHFSNPAAGNVDSFRRMAHFAIYFDR
jgi:hypothetical protein